MNEKLTKQLFDKYPLIFQNKDLPDSKSRICDGFRCDDGWYDLIDILCATLEVPKTFVNQIPCWADDYPHEYFRFFWPQVVAFQVKEKLARLVFYYDLKFCQEFEDQSREFLKTGMALEKRAWEYCNGAIAMAANMSEKTCEITGLPGFKCISRSGVWYKTLCEEKAKELGFERLVEKSGSGS